MMKRRDDIPSALARRRELAVVLLAWLELLSIIPCAVGAETDGPALKTPAAQFLTLESPITDDVISWVRSTAGDLERRAREEGRKAFLVIEVPPGVSEFHQVYGLADLLTSQPLSGVTTIAWVPETVTGPNALIALACNEIVLHPDAKLGDLGRGRAVPRDQQAIVREIVAKRGNPKVSEALATAMMDPQTILLILSVEVRPGEIEKRVATEIDAQRLRESGATIRDSRTIKEPGADGTFSGTQARHDDIIVSQSVATRRELAENYGFDSEALREVARPSSLGTERPTLIEVEGMIDPVLASFLMRQIDRAVESGSKVLVFEITSPGGYLQQSLDLSNAIADLETQGVRTVAYVPKEAISGAAIIALGCDEIYLRPEAKIGDAGPIELTAGGQFEHVPEKLLSYLRRALNILAERKHRPPALAEAMCDKDLDVYEVVHATKGTVWYMSEDEIAAAGDEWTKGKIVPEAKGNLLLTLNGARAHELKIAEAPVKDLDDLKTRLGISAEVKLQRAQRLWIDDLVFWLNRPAIVGLLFVIAIVCIYFELHMMTGVLGLCAAFCFVLFFWSKWLGGTAGGLEILLFVFGLFALGMEIFVIPGVGVFGVTGVISLVASLVMASQTFNILDQQHNIEDATRTVGTLGLSIMTVAAIALTVSRYMPQIPLLKHMILTPPGSVGLGDPGQPRLNPHVTATVDPRVGRQGVARTLLRPAGKALVNGHVLDVVSEGGMIPAGRSIEIVQVANNRIIVRETDSPA